MSSSGPMTGRNSGIRSIGLATHRPATTTAILALRGTRGSLRRRRTVVTQSGMNAARSRSRPGGSRRAASSSTAQLATRQARAIPRPTNQFRTNPSSQRGRAGPGDSDDPEPLAVDRDDVTPVQLAPASDVDLAVDADVAVGDPRFRLAAGVAPPGQLEELPEPDRVVADRHVPYRPAGPATVCHAVIIAGARIRTRSAPPGAGP